MDEKEMKKSEQDKMVLWYVSELLKYIEGTDMTLGDALCESMEQYESDAFCLMVYKTIEDLRDKGYLEGNISIMYESDITNDETKSDKIAYGLNTLENVKITSKGTAVLTTDKLVLKAMHVLKKAGGQMIECGKKAFPILLPTVLNALLYGKR